MVAGMSRNAFVYYAFNVVDVTAWYRTVCRDNRKVFWKFSAYNLEVTVFFCIFALYLKMHRKPTKWPHFSRKIGGNCWKMSENGWKYDLSEQELEEPDEREVLCEDLCSIPHKPMLCMTQTYALHDTNLCSVWHKPMLCMTQTYALYGINHDDVASVPLPYFVKKR